MHLFGRLHEPHLAHFHAWHRGDRVELHWEVRNSPPLAWRVLRSEEDFAAGADDTAAAGQVVVMEGTQTHVTDRPPGGARHHFYTVFERDSDGPWERQVEAKVNSGMRVRWHRSEDEARGLDETDAATIHDAQVQVDLGVYILRCFPHGPPSGS